MKISTAMVLMLLAVAAGAAGTAAPAAVSRFAPQVLERGSEAQLPPHLAMTLSVSDGSRPVPVRQAASRVGTLVHTYNVVSGAHRQVVLISTDEASHETSAYLLRADGSLRRAVHYQSGGMPEVLAPAAAGSGFRRELRFWNQTLGGVAAPAAHGPDAAVTHP
jgi:hypothetical protein